MSEKCRKLSSVKFAKGDKAMIEKYVYHFSPDNLPVETVEKGAVITLKTLDCFSNQIQSSEQLVTSIDFNHVNPATGPVYVNGAEAGDVLVVDIIKIQVADHGVTSTLPEIGPLIEFAGGPRTKIIPIKNGKAVFNDVEFPINPMIGVIGVAPKEGSVPCGLPGSHGGNMDCNKIVEGSRLYFPVRTNGALFQLGDLHATMGDGEICGTGIEIAGEVTVKLDLIKNSALDWPVLETGDKWYSIASDEKFETALKYAGRSMQKLVSSAYGWDETDAYLYMSIQGDFEICQGCKPSTIDVVVRFGVPKLGSKPRLI